MYSKCRDDTSSNDTDGTDNNSSASSDEMFQGMVAITDVPPDQIPEGLLNLARGHRSSIEHIRVAVTDDLDHFAISSDEQRGGDDYDDYDDDGDNNGCRNKDDCGRNERQVSEGVSNSWSQSPTKHHEDAALMLAEEMRKEGNEKIPNSTGNIQKKKRYLVLISMSSNKAADSFVRCLDGKPYNSFERDVTASVYHVAKLESDGADSEMDGQNGSPRSNRRKGGGGKSLISPYKSLSIPAEKQNCAVCLEPMEYPSANSTKKECTSPNGTSGTSKRDSSSIFTTVCNHTFHTECLLRCQDSPCPVCRYDHSGLNDTLSQCHVCGTTERIHVCLICGVASCWKPTSQDCDRNSNSKNSSLKGTESLAVHNCNSIGHARQHYDETLHAYALDTETQHVWDFAGQGYVHRLIQNVDDGKIVEISDPRSGAMERSSIPVLSDTQEGEVVHRKLEGYASEYYTLLKSQLEQQRVYYEGVMEKIRRDHKPKTNGTGSSELIAALKQDRNQLQQRCHVLQRKRNKVADDLKFLKNMNESLEANKEPLKRQIMSLQKQRTETAEMLQRCLPALEKKLASLMLELENDD